MESILSSIDSTEEISEDDNILSSNANNNDNNESSFVSFTNALRQFVLTDDTSATATSSASTAVSSSNNNNKDDTAKWLYNTCSKLPTPLPPLQFTIETLSAINQSDESKMQSTLFELFGEGEKSIEILFEIIGKADEIRKNVTVNLLKQVAECVDGNVATNGNAGGGSSTQQQQHDRLFQLRSDAYESTNLAVAIRTEQQHQQSSGYTSRGTHSITRKSDKEAEKTYKRIIKQAITAVNVAREAGALTESDDLFLVSQLPSVANSKSNGNTNGNNCRGGMEQMLRNEEALLYNSNNHTRGLDGMSSEQIQSMKYNLAPEGTKQYNDSSTRGLPKGTERIYEKHYEKVIIPAPVREKSLLRSRINLDEVLGEGTDERLAFGGVKSLNPMQSTVFDSAYRSRENLLICAPTGKSLIDMWLYETFLK